MKKKNLFILIIIACVAFAQPQPVRAFSFQSLTQSITARISRLYLKIVPGNKNSESVLRQSLMASENLETAIVETTVDGQFAGTDEDGVGAFNFVVKGPMKLQDVYQPQNSQQDLNISGNFTTEGETADINLDVKQDQHKAFIKINNIPDLGLIDANQLMSKWLYWDLETVEGEEVKELTPQQRKEIEKITQDFIQSIELSPAKKTKKDGEAVFVIDGAVDKQELANYLLALDKVVKNEDQDSLTQEEAQEFLQAVNNINFTIWIRRADFFLTYFELSFDANLETATKQGASSAEMMGPNLSLNQAQSMALTITSDLSDFNKEVSFAIPEDTVDGQQAIMEAMNLGGMFNFEGLGSMPEMDQLPNEALIEKPQNQMPEMQDIKDMPGYDDLPAEIKEQLNQ